MAGSTKALVAGLLVRCVLSVGRVSAIDCCGDCDGDGRVHVAEVVRAVGIALGHLSTDACPGHNAAIDGLVCAVGSLLHGCVLPTVTATGTPTVTATPTLRPSPPTPVWTLAPSVTITPDGPGPDLVVDSIRTRHDSASSCGPFESLVVCVANRGDAASGAFTVELIGVESFPAASLDPLEVRCVSRPLTRASGSSFTVVVDSEGAVAEADEANNVRTQIVSWPTIRATCTATMTRTPEPPSVRERATSTPGPQTTWMTLIPCRQCEVCDMTIAEQQRFHAGESSWVAAFVPAGVEILDQHTSTTGAVCAACGCPQSGSPILDVLVHISDLEAMRTVGWVAHR